jgi:gliding motility-associated-like protein
MINSHFKLTVAIITAIISAELVNSQEIANNGIDDDNDGFVDCFDSELYGTPGCEPFYFGQPIPECREKPPVLSSYTLVEKYRTDIALHPIDQRSGVFVGDMTNDGTPDMVSKHPGTGRLYIFNGIDGTLEQEFNQTNNTDALSQLVIGDVDRDGWGDAFVAETDRYIRRYEYDNSLPKGSVNNGGPVWTSSERIQDDIQTPQLTDFNGDGTPELYVANGIFNAIDGTRLVAYNTGVNSGKQSGRNDAFTHAYNVFNQGDLIPGGGGATYGSEADGLELIAGDQIFFVDLGDGTQDNGSLTLALETTIAGVTNGDGFASVADLNGDNRIDIIVTGKRTDGKAVIFAYDPYTNQQIGTTYLISSASTYVGRANVADFDNDGDVEIGTAGKNIYVVVEYNPDTEVLETKWEKTGMDDGSQVTGSTVFDFEGDGTAEVVYSEEENLYIWKGKDGSEMAKIVSQSGTRTDYPLVADVDGDGQSEIVITAQTGNGPGFSGTGWISVYRSKDAPWLPARESWNQHGYHVTNLGQDLTIPANQQLIVDPNFSSAFNQAFNGFLTQTTFLTEFADPTFAVGDLTTENVIVDLEQCVASDSVTFTVTLENNGDWKAPRYTPLAIFDGDPYATTATYLGTIYTPDNVEKGGTLDITHTVYDNDGDGTMKLYVLVNHYEETLAIGDALPVPLTGVTSPTMECDYANNVGFIVDITTCNVSNAPRLDLDRDNSGGVAGNGFKKAFGVASSEGAAIVDEDVFIIDDDNTNMASATITLTNRPDGTDEYLQHPDTGSSVNGVTISAYNSSTGEITLTGSASLSVYEDILKGITYYNTLDNATITSVNRIVEIQISDGINLSNVAVDSVLIEYKPTLDLDFDNSSGASGNDFSTSYTENGNLVQIVDADVYIETNGLDVQSVTIQHTNIQDGAYEGLYVIGTLPAGITVSAEYEYSVGTLVLSGAASPADYQTALRRVFYADSSDAPDVTDRLFTVQVTDIYLESLEANTTISITPVNDAPIITGPADSIFYNEGQAAVNIVEYDFIVDIDDTEIESASIAIGAGFDNTEDVLAFTNQNGITGAYNATTGVLTLTGTATIAQYQAAIASITYQNADALDASAATRTINIIVNDGDANSNTYSREIYVNINPVITSAASVAIFDGATAVMIVTATDENLGDTQTYSITGGTDGSDFNIDPSTGALALNNSADYATKSSYQVEVTVTDQGGLTTSQTITVTVNNPANPAPSIGDYSISIDEDTPNFWTIHDIDDENTGNDTDNNGDAITYSLTAGNVDNIFGINPANGYITVDDNTNLDYESREVYYLTINASDGSTSDNAVITVNINNINDNNPLIADSTISISEADTNNKPVIDINDLNTSDDTDLDEEALLYSIQSGNGAGVFGIDANTGELFIADNSSLDYEVTKQYTLVIRADDGVNTDDATITIDVTGINDNNPLISDITIGLNENTANTTLVHDVDDDNTSADTDIDEEALTYSIVSGNAAGVFTINSSTGEITVLDNSNLDFETNPQFVLTVRADDGENTDDAVITINVNDIVEVVSFTIDAISNVTINENTAYTSVTPSITGTPIDTLAYTISGADAADFSIDPNTGVVTMVGRNYEIPVDANTDNVYELTITATDADGNSDSEDWTVTVLDVIEAASFTIDAISNVTVNENTAYTSVTPNITGTPIGNVTYTISGADAADFSIDPNIGVVTMVGRNYENPVDANTDNVYELTITATDDDGNSDSEDWTVTVQDVVEVVSFTIDAIADVTIDENTAYTSVTPNITGSPIGNVTYTISGTDAADFSIDAATGVVSMVGRDYENPVDDNTDNVYVLTITATDDDGNSDSEDWTVTVQDVVEVVSFTIDAIADVNIDENTAYTSVTPNITGSPIGNVTYTIGGADAAYFSIDAVTGVVSMVGRDYENPVDANTDNVYELTITATDADGNSDSEDWTVTIDNVAESATFSIDAIGNVTIDENTPYTSVTPAITGSPIGSVAYSLAGADATDFTIDAVTGVVSMVARDYEAPVDGNTDNVYEVTIIATDDDGNTANESWSVTILPVNEVTPTATDDVISVDEDGSVADNVSSNDSGLEDSPVTFSVQSDVNNGSLTLNNDGSYTYEPNAGYNGFDSFVYEVCDADGECDQATVTITVNDIDDTPVANDDNPAVDEDGTLNSDVSSNDTGLEDTPVTFTLISDVSNGTLVLNNDGTYSYTPAAGFNGNDSFVYEVCDNNGDCNQATVNITVNPVDDTPVANDDAASVDQDGTLNDNVATNDTDLEDSPVTYTEISGVSNGSLTLNPDGSYTYIPTPGYLGSDSFTYEVCDADGDCDQATVNITVDNIDYTPVANDDTESVDEDGSLSGDVSLNDNDLNDPPITFTVQTDVSNGTLSLNTDGTYTYDPEPGFNGTDSFVYEVCDSDSDCDQATVTITVNSVNDTPAAVNDNPNVDEDGTLTDNVSTNDTGLEDGPITFTLVTDVSNGTLVLNNDGSYTYSPDPGYNGSDSFVYEVCDTDGDCSQATVSITVNSVNDTLEATDDAISVDQDDSVNGDVSTNDSGLEDTPVTYSVVTDVTDGTLTFNTDGTFDYVPSPGFSGSDSFTYQVCDNDGECATATVSITVNEVITNTAPNAADDFETLEMNQELNGGNLLANDFDSDGDNLTINTTPVSDPANGTVTINIDGTFTYTPDVNFTGTDSFVYEVCDDGTPSMCDQATVSINVFDNDYDNDGIPNDEEGTDDPDGDGIPSNEDPDSDGDGIYDSDEGNGDTDGDGTPDYKDDDSDNDGIPDEEEGNSDTDGDGTPDYIDTDSDDDGIPDEDEGTDNPDGDADPNYRDTDSDDDGILDGDEIAGDCDNDGLDNAYDSDPCREGDIFVPEGFSPNNDGQNDFFEIPEVDQYNHVSIRIYNRWGNLVFENNNYENDWDGTSNVNMSIGTELPTGTYFYQLVILDTDEHLTGYIYLNR